MTTDKRREDFEAAFVRKYGFGRMTASSNEDAMAMYSAAWWAWNDALDSVVVDLPECFDKRDVQGLDYDKVVSAIESAGVRVAK